MSTLTENITRAINDLGDIKEAIKERGVEVPAGTATSEYAGLVSGLVNPSQIPDPSASLPLVAGEAECGSSNDYARADHRHPSDPSKADLADVPTTVSQLFNDAGYVTSGELADYVTLSEYDTLVSRVEELEQASRIPEQWTYIEFKIDSSDGTYIIPLSQETANDLGYSLSVYVNGIHQGDYAGIVNYFDGTGIELTGLAEPISTITLRPTGSPYAGWGRAFGHNSVEEGANVESNKAKLLSIINDPDYAHLADEISTGPYFRYAQYYGCVSLTSGPDSPLPEERLPDTVKFIGEGFCCQQYSYCTSLTIPAKEFIPDSVIYIGASFRSGQYYFCTSLTLPAKEFIPESVRYIGQFFRGEQYGDCSALTLTTEEFFPDSVTSISGYFRSGQYSYCTSLTTAAQEYIPGSVKFIDQGFRERMYTGCTSLTLPAEEFIPDSVMEIEDEYFRRNQYSNCSSLRIGSHIHHHRFERMLSTNSHCHSIFSLNNVLSEPDTVPRYYTDSSNTITAPVTDLTPTMRKYYLTNRTGIEGYDELHENWK